MNTSPKRAAANRSNAAHSTGPRTPEGKARSSQNARKYTFNTIPYAIYRLEDPQVIANLRADAIDRYRPADSQELFAVERIALAQLNLLRMASLEAGLGTNFLDVALDRPGAAHLVDREELTHGEAVPVEQNRNYILAAGFRCLAAQSNAISLFLRYQSQAERLYRRAVEEFDRLKALRHEIPNEPIEETEPQETTPLTSTPPPANEPTPKPPATAPSADPARSPALDGQIPRKSPADTRKMSRN